MPRLLAILGLAAAAAALPAGCAKRSDAYRFRAPVVSSVRAAELPPRSVASSREPSQRHARAHLQPPVALDGPYGHQPATQIHTDEITTDEPLANALRSMVGTRDRKATQIGFVWNALDTLGSPIDPDVRAASDAATLVSLVRERGALSVEGNPLLGDLIVFDKVLRGDQPYRIGVVVGARSDGTVELIYLARNVIRRGFVNRDTPHFKRDPNGRSINTIMRQKYGHGKKGHGDLTGDLYVGFVRLERLAPH